MGVTFDYFNYLHFMKNLFYSYLHIFQRAQSFYIDEIVFINKGTFVKFDILPSTQGSLKRAQEKKKNKETLTSP